MDRDQWHRIKQLHSGARELAGDQRERYLAANCATAEERDELNRLLASEATTEDMQTPAAGQYPRAADFHPGDKLGRYEIQTLLGEGGGGRVYRALDPTLHRQVALKVLPPAVAAEAPARRRFLREAETASRLNHPSIITVYEVGTDNGTDFIAMEYIAGKSLRESITKHGLPPAQLYQWAIEIAEALAAAHEAGVVHRDLKPGNVMITSRGTAKVLDFGLAKTVYADATAETVTPQGTVMGTCAYMAPEQAEGRTVDSRADIFSFGCVLYEMATGRTAFTGGSQISVLGGVLHDEPRPPSELAPNLPKGFDQLVTQCLRKDPAKRWQSAADVRIILEQLQHEQQSAKASVRAQHRGTWWKVAAAVTLGALLAVIAGYLYLQRAPRAEPLYRTLALTSDPGLSSDPSLSADGRLMAYSSDRGGDGNLDIWVQQIGAQAPIRLTRDPADETDPDLSPDGTLVVFRSEREGGGIYVMPSLGGEPFLLVQGGRNPKFSPDGKSVAYWTGFEGAALSAGSARAYIIPAGGGQPTPLGNDLVTTSHPVWSPAGNALLALGRKNPDTAAERLPDWWVLSPLGDASRPTGAAAVLWADDLLVSPPLSQHQFVPLLWSKQEGGGVIFAARCGDSVNLWKLALSPNHPQASERPVRMTGGPDLEMHAAVAPAGDASRIAYTSAVLQFDLWSIPVDVERAVARGEIRRITEDRSWEFYPSVSWDARKIAYSTRRGGAHLLCVRDLASGKETTLLTAPAPVLDPFLSGDGQWIAFTDYEGSISRIGTRGGGASRLCDKCGSPTGVSFDAGSIVLEPLGTDDVRVLNALTGKTTSLANGTSTLYSGNLSRDGRWVVFNQVAQGSPTSRIFVARVEDGTAMPLVSWIPITDGAALQQGPRWSPAGNAVYFLSERDGFRCLWARQLDPSTKKPVGQPAVVQHFHHVRRSLQHLASFDERTRLAVAGDQVLVALGELTGNIWLRESAR